MTDAINDTLGGNSMVDLLKEEDIEQEIEEVEQTDENPAVDIIPTNAPYPKTAIIANLKAWLGVVMQAEDLSDDLKDQINSIPEFHFNAFATKVQTDLMRTGVYKDKDGRLTENKKKGVKLV